MVDLRDLEMLEALARHEHFARAAEACGISQPAFSARIRHLEATLGVPVVKRGNRFLGLTPEGDIVLRWARRMLQDADGLRQEVEAAKGELSGRLSIGAVPTAVTFAARVPPQMQSAHPGLSMQLLSMASADILRGIEDFTLDAGITYLDDSSIGSLKTIALYDETRNMRNRRIVDEIFASVGAVPSPVMETNAFVAALAQVASGTLATIAPELLANSLPIAETAVRLKLVQPEATRPIGLVMADRDPLPPALRAFSNVIRLMVR